MDEVSTLIFSLGNSSYRLPVTRVVDLDAILRPLMYTPEATPWESAQYLLQENNHPPAYFMLAHVWMDWFPTADGVASLVVARVFSVLLGTLAIPLIFWLSKNVFQSALAGVISAAFLAVSPLHVFLAQEARHYGLAVTLITISLGFFVIATRAVWHQRTPGWFGCLAWIFVNVFAFANHYFSALTFAAEGLLLSAIAGQQWRQQGIAILWKPYWRRIYLVALGTLAGVLVWLPTLLNFYGSPQSSFLRDRSGGALSWFNPIAHTLAATIVSVISPANFYAATPLEIAGIVLSIIGVLWLAARLIPLLIRGAQQLYQQPEGRIGIIIIGGFWLIMLGIFALICYGYGADITRGLRYKFTYYPAIMVMLGGIFSQYWAQRSSQDSLSVALPFTQRRWSGRRAVQFVWVASLVSSLLVVNGFAFPKFYAPERFIPFVQQHSSAPIVLASTEKIAEQPTVIGAKFLSVAWEIQRRYPPADPASGWLAAPRFFVLRQGYGVMESEAKQLAARVNEITGPFDLWLIRSDVRDDDPLLTDHPSRCALASEAPHGNKGAYAYIHYQCSP